MSLKNYGHVSGRPHIKVGYGKSIGKVGQNVQRKIGLKMKKMGASVKSFGYGK